MVVELSEEAKLAMCKTMNDSFETIQFREYAEDMEKLMPSNIFYLPASSSGKYHNKQQNDMCGQMMHVSLALAILNHLLKLETNRNAFPYPEQRDALRCAVIFHDAWKYGTDRLSEHTDSDHPYLSSQWIKYAETEHDIPDEYKDAIANMCASHMGEWGKVKPNTLGSVLIHECDYIASRKDISWSCDEELYRMIGIITEEIEKSA